MNSSASILLPKIDLPADYKVEELHKEVGSASTLGHLIEKFLPFSPAARSHSVKVEEKSKVFIGVPTVLQIKSAFRVTNEKLKFIRENNTSPDLKGITSKNGVFTNSSVVICDGDLYLDGLAYFNNLRLVTTTGCRIYSTGSVFIYGPISYVDKQADSNIQILSARSIQIGLGSIYKENKVCETTGWFAVESNRKAWSDISHDSLILRQNFGVQTGLSEKSRSQPDGKIAAEKVLEDYAQVTSNFGKQDDASCRPEGRNVGFDHIMMIAPSIHSRYQGNINGSLVAETALMALGQFKFAYDPVFDRVPIFPFIDHDQYLVIE